MLKKNIISTLLISALLLAGCANNGENGSASSAQNETSSAESEVAEVRTPDFTNLTYDNGSGRMGDTDGPAYVVYSKKGFNKATVDIRLSAVEVKNVKKNNRFVNAYIFLGIDVYDANGYWINCADAGLCYSGRNGYWHLFYNIYKPKTEGAQSWYESKVKLDASHDYRLILDSSEEDKKVIITIYDLTDDKVADSKEFGIAHSLASGANTSFLQNYALDYPEDVKFDTKGNPSANDWVEITLFNTDQGLYMKNVEITRATLANGDNEVDWTEEHTSNRAMWPDKNIAIDYEVVKVYKESFDNAFTVTFDMNRRK
ncbi:MAG TPA: hypothetical protein PLD48_01790 [Bacillota bacterium]|nr:hypothetical protein [Bacillota bacterium]HOK68072.1 hypothetical protein [Bacillota bacterium]HPP84373.1 hypothetical protein [Bacillota bacterium]